MASEEQDVEHFKGKLYSSFRDAGLMDNLKVIILYFSIIANHVLYFLINRLSSDLNY